MIHLKITKIGNSAGVVLPKEVLNNLNVSVGDTLILTNSSEGYRVTPYNEKFDKQMTAARRIAKDWRNALRHLAK
jgi:putative addiction module antidote